MEYYVVSHLEIQRNSHLSRHDINRGKITLVGGKLAGHEKGFIKMALAVAVAVESVDDTREKDEKGKPHIYHYARYNNREWATDERQGSENFVNY